MRVVPGYSDGGCGMTVTAGLGGVVASRTVGVVVVALVVVRLAAGVGVPGEAGVAAGDGVEVVGQQVQVVRQVQVRVRRL